MEETSQGMDRRCSADTGPQRPPWGAQFRSSKGEGEQPWCRQVLMLKSYFMHLDLIWLKKGLTTPT